MKLKHCISGTELPPRRHFRRAAIAVVAISSVFAVSASPVAEAVAPARVASADDPVVALAQDALLTLHGSGDDQALYPAKRDLVAAAVASRLAIDPALMSAAWASADLEHQQAVLTGLTQLGVPYRRNTSTPGVGFDCSGLTTYAWAGAGVTLVRQSSAQIQAAAPRTVETAQAGDLMQYPGHVMMWLGVGRAALQAPNPGRTVEVVLYRSGRRVRVGDPTG